MKNRSPYGLHWFRRDLRIAGNRALQENWKKHQGRILGFFCFDPKFLARPDFSANRFGFFLETMQELKKELQSSGGDLLVLDEGPVTAFEKLFFHLSEQKIPLPTTCSFNRDYEPFARERDSIISSLLEKKYSMTVITERDHLVFEPGEILKNESEGFYQIYSPFAKKWLEKIKKTEFSARIDSHKNGLDWLEKREKEKNNPPVFSLTWKEFFDHKPALVDQLDFYLEQNRKKITVPLPPAGSSSAYQALKLFEPKLDHYGEKRDFPAEEGTSRLSIYLKNGSLTTSQVIAYLNLKNLSFNEQNGKTKYLKEIIWREFYYSILYHSPRVEKESFVEKYKTLKWENRPDFFEAWKNGKTGYPIVDAGMRELQQTGWIHNRVRMIVASFLTKDLLIDWRWGEQFFMQQLLDGDLAPNNGGWQWSASTGCDPQPYFRIFNPTLQSQKFDPNGNYLRKFIPELKEYSANEIHEPHLSPRRSSYPFPIVNHSERKKMAIDLYKEK